MKTIYDSSSPRTSAGGICQAICSEPSFSKCDVVAFWVVAKGGFRVLHRFKMSKCNVRFLYFWVVAKHVVSSVASFQHVKFSHLGLLQNLVFACWVVATTVVFACCIVSKCEVFALLIVAKGGYRVLHRFKMLGFRMLGCCKTWFSSFRNLSCFLHVGLFRKMWFRVLRLAFVFLGVQTMWLRVLRRFKT